MANQQTWLDLIELRKRWKVSRAWLIRLHRAGRLPIVSTVNGPLVHKDHYEAFERLHPEEIRLGVVEKEVEDITRTQLKFEFSDLIHDLSPD